MATRTLTLDELAAAARRLSPRDRLRLIERLAAELNPSVSPEAPGESAPATNESGGPVEPRPSLYGL